MCYRIQHGFQNHPYILYQETSGEVCGPVKNTLMPCPCWTQATLTACQSASNTAQHLGPHLCFLAACLHLHCTEADWRCLSCMGTYTLCTPGWTQIHRDCLLIHQQAGIESLVDACQLQHKQICAAVGPALVLSLFLYLHAMYPNQHSAHTHGCTITSRLDSAGAHLGRFSSASQ